MDKIITKNAINEKIYYVRDVYVMLDSELAQIYGVETKVFNQAIKRNIERFPEKFRFQLTELEYQNLRSQIVTSSLHGGRRYLPHVFTEQGVAMLSAILKSKTAIEISLQVMDAFVKMREIISSNREFIHRLFQIERQQISFELKTTEKFEALFSALENKTLTKTQGIFFEGQIFDAHVFVSDLIKQAKKSIVLIDNYIDETVLTQLSKANPKIKIYLLTKSLSNALKLDIKKYNDQYANIILIEFGLSHDRFLILDQKEIYHIGASLKDLGKKWFAFSKFKINSFGLMEKINTVVEKSNQSRG